MLYFVKELAEYYLLFSGTLLLMGAKAYTADFWPAWVSHLTEVCAAKGAALLHRMKLFRTFATAYKHVNSIVRSRLDKVLQRPTPNSDFAKDSDPKDEFMIKTVPEPVGACLKWVLMTGQVALFSAFVAFGN